MNDSGSTNDGAAPAAAPTEGETSMIASLLLQDLHSSSPPAAVSSTSKILIKLLRNAASGNPKHGTIRLTNPKIQRHVVQVPGALDVLGAAGFGMEEGRGGEYLTFRGPPPAAAVERDSSSDGPRPLIDALCDGLEALVAESEPPPAAGAAPVPAATAAASRRRPGAAAAPPGAAAAASKPAESASKPAPPVESSSESDFLSEKERLARIAKIKAEKKAQKAQREAAKRRWAEDMEEKKAAARRREAALGAVIKKDMESEHSYVRIERRGRERLPLAKPFEEPKKFVGSGGGGGADAQAVRRRLIQECMKDRTLDAKEKQGKIQELMKMSEGAVLAMANAPAAAPAPAATATAASSKSKPDEGTEMATDDGPAKMPASAASKEPPGAYEMDIDDRKPAAKPPPELSHSPQPHTDLGKARAPTPPSPEWTKFVERTPRCAGAEGIRDSSVFFRRGGPASFDAAIPMCLKRLFKELDGLKDSLPSDPNCSIWLRFDEETPQYIRALVAAPLPGPTPYSGGLFAFDVYVPNDYPRTNPRIQLLTTGGGRVRFGPNLYADGKVCLSLLGTWPGPKWDPRHSSLYQVLISIQGLILGVEHPYYLEPGHGGWEGKVKDGDFQVTGQTLAGEAVQQEVGVPLQVILYEDVLRVGTARYAMAQPLKEALDEKRSTSMGKTGLEAFGHIVRAHFCENRDAVLAEVKNWMSDHALGRDRGKALERAPAGTLSIDALRGLLPKLEELLSKASMPQGGVDAAESAPVAGAVDVAMNVEEELKPAAQPLAPLVGDGKLLAKPRADEIEQQLDTAAGKSNEPASDRDVVEQKRQRMQEAAKDGDFILAGKIQEEVKRLEELQSSMQEAARQGDFIRAGRLQAQFKALTGDHAAAAAKGAAAAMAHSNQPPSDPGWGDDNWGEGGSDSDEEEMEWSDDGMEEGGPPFGPGGHPHGPPPGPGHFPQGPGTYPPPGHPAHAKRKWGKHSWGTGQTLAAPPTVDPPESSPSDEGTSKKAAAPEKTIPPDQLCRLRVRLPQDKSVVEDFDKNDSLTEVYRRLEASILPDRGRADGTEAAVGGASVPGGAFSQPLSMAGFTLLLARPKREFNLEMHGTRSLAELNLAPSATLTVMRCRERGVVYRGEVESRLQSAQGDAMDVEGLTYEGLMELTERVGKAAPKEGEAFLALTAEEFDASTTKISPSTYLADLDGSSEEYGEEDRRCPICLGCYDGSDDALTLRIVNNCGHTMHSSCLQTWLGTNSSCPLCKVTIVVK